MTLVILAAGMGSRFGGLKQIEAVGKNNEFIIDYSIHDAIKAGFTKVVFIIKEENEKIFKETIGKRFENKIEIQYAFQDNKYIPEYVLNKTSRIKPFGTAHAILCAKEFINEKFAIINADDFYGYEAFDKMYKTLSKFDYALVAYEVKNTLSKTGSVKRGLCEEKDGYLKNIVESIIEEEEVLYASNLDKTNKRQISENSLVSMNLIGFDIKVLDYLEKDINDFFENQTDLDTCEYLIPTVCMDLIEKNMAQFKLEKTNSKWLGITYLEDLKYLKEEISKLDNYEF